MDKALSKIRRILSSEKQIEAAYLFGSRATANASPNSDFDIAIVSKSKAFFSSNKLRLLSALSGAGIDAVDLVEVSIEDLPLAFQVIKKNYLIFKKPTFDSSEFYVKILHMYFDFEYILRTQIQGQKKRLRNSHKIA